MSEFVLPVPEYRIFIDPEGEAAEPEYWTRLHAVPATGDQVLVGEKHYRVVNRTWHPKDGVTLTVRGVR